MRTFKNLRFISFKSEVIVMKRNYAILESDEKKILWENKFK